MTNIYQQEIESGVARADDSVAERICGLFCLGLHRDAWIGQKYC
jgi:hypothetical protein